MHAPLPLLRLYINLALQELEGEPRQEVDITKLSPLPKKWLLQAKLRPSRVPLSI